MRRFNIFSGEPEYDEDEPEGYRAGMARFGPQLGATKTGASLYELPAGQSICPYHYEYGEEEWLIVLEGRPTLRRPGGEEELEPGDTVCFPEGPDGAHKVTNRTEDRVRVLMFSTVNHPAIAVYPDSDKFGVITGNAEDRLFVKRESNVDYYEGERHA
jgi:uncharacterized cupin superfamily protein